MNINSLVQSNPTMPGLITIETAAFSDGRFNVTFLESSTDHQQCGRGYYDDEP
jgi:hypothetical protein